MLARSLAMLVGALTLGAATADAASAGTINAIPSIQGAGTISTPFTTTHAAYSCTQPDPVTAATALTCRDVPWRASGFVGIGPAQMALAATPAPGLTFAGWSGCPSAAGAVCTIDAPAGNTTVDAAPRARFEDRMHHLRFRVLDRRRAVHGLRQRHARAAHAACAARRQPHAAGARPLRRPARRSS